MRWEWMISLGLLCSSGLLAGCPGGGTGGPGKGSNTTPPIDPVDPKIDLPNVPAKLEVTTSAPTDNNAPDARSPVLDILKAEVDREMAVLKQQKDPAYYLSYHLIEQRTVSLDAEGGALISDSDETSRFLDTDIRVGKPELDNTRDLADAQDALNNPLVRKGVVPFGEDKQAISNALWLETERRYREAVSALSYVKQDQATLKVKKDTAPDFSFAPAEVHVEKPVQLVYDKAQWIDRLKRCSAKALKGQATRGTCGLLLTQNILWIVTSEGTQLQLAWTNSQLSVSVGVKADDGMNLSRLEQRFGRQPGDLPPDSEIDKMIATVTSDLDALHAAPLAEPYVGPAILQGRASGVFFHEVFGHRIEGHRQKQNTEGQTFTSMINKPIAPDWLSVYDDPQLVTLNGIQLNGFYRYDDEGVRASHVPLITSGKFVGFEMSRNPIKGFPTSNGHGRHSQGLPAVARQGNLVVSATKSVPYTDLEKMLIAEVKRQNKPFGMIFTDISGGFTLTNAFQPQSFKVLPVMAYRLYPDGKRELVRGVDIGGTPLTALSSIRAASREVETFNGVCGAESGWVPVSASAPSLLLERLELEKGFIPPDRPPVLGPPGIKQQLKKAGAQ